MNQVLEKLSTLSNGKALVIGMVLGALYYFMMYDDGSSQLAQIQALDQQLIAAEAKRKDTEATLQEEARMKDAVGKLSEQYAFISKKLPSELKSSEMIRSIDVVAKSSGVSVKLKKPGSIEKGEVVEDLPIDVSLEGTYSQVTQFIYQTSNLERLTRIMNFSIVSQNPEEGIEKGLRFEGQVVSYKLAPEPEKNSAEPARGGTP